jgi:hypothetical protein
MKASYNYPLQTLYTPDMRSLLHTLKALRGRTSDQFVTSLEEERSRQEYVTGLITRERLVVTYYVSLSLSYCKPCIRTNIFYRRLAHSSIILHGY